MFNVFRILFVGVVVAVSACISAAAQTAGDDVIKAVVIDTKPLIEQLVPYIVAAAGGIITTLGLIVTAWLKKKWNIEVDAQRRDELLAAVKNVAAGAIANGAAKVEQNGKVTIQAGVLANIAKDVVENRAPDAVQHFSITPDDVAKRIVEQVPQILTGSTPSAAPAAAPPK